MCKIPTQGRPGQRSDHRLQVVPHGKLHLAGVGEVAGGGEERLTLLPSQYGVQLYDWDGANMVFEYDFQEQGVALDERQVGGCQDRLCSSFLSAGDWSTGERYRRSRQLLHHCGPPHRRGL